MFVRGETEGRARCGRLISSRTRGRVQQEPSASFLEQRSNFDKTNPDSYSISTPTCFISTHYGFPTHLPVHLLHQLKELHHLQVNFNDFYQSFTGSDLNSGKTLHNFLGLEDHILLVTLREPASFEDGALNPSSIPITASSGKITVTPENYVNTLKKYEADFYTSFGVETHQHSAKKRKLKANELSLQWLDKTIQLVSPEEAEVKLFAVINNNGTESNSVNLAREAAKRSVFGYSIGGFDMGESFNDREKTLLPILSELPKEKPRMITCIGTPRDVLQAISFGFDIINSNYPEVVTEQGCALVFPLAFSDTIGSGMVIETYSRVETGADNLRIDANDEADNYLRDDHKINLWDKRYLFDTSPILSTCLCFTCTHHTRAYIHHLLNTHEMLASILLSMHNHHHYFAFFRSIREHITNQTFHRLRQKFAQKKIT